MSLCLHVYCQLVLAGVGLWKMVLFLLHNFSIEDTLFRILTLLGRALLRRAI